MMSQLNKYIKYFILSTFFQKIIYPPLRLTLPWNYPEFKIEKTILTRGLIRRIYGTLNSPQPWTVHCLVTKKSADAQFSKSLYLPHNKSNQSEASNCCFVVDHKISRARSLFFSHFCYSFFPIIFLLSQALKIFIGFTGLLWEKYSDLGDRASADFFVTRFRKIHGCGGYG